MSHKRVQITLRIREDLLKKLKDEAENDGRTVSNLIETRMLRLYPVRSAEQSNKNEESSDNDYGL